jgi:aerobic carbon-monoxide dehydrogenase large subunit
VRQGVGEAGTIGSPPAVVNAVIDALSPLGVTDIGMPATPERVWRAIPAAKSKGGPRLISAPFDYEAAHSH